LLRGKPGERDSDVRTRLEAFARNDGDRHSLQQIRRSADAYARQLGLDPGTPTIEPEDAGWLLALAYPDRIARSRSPGSGRYLLSNGRGAFFAQPEALAKSEYLVVPDLEAGEKEARIHLAAPVTAAELETHLAGTISTAEDVRWDSREQLVVARRQRRLGAILLADDALRGPSPADVSAAMLVGIRELGLGALPWTPELRQWQSRVLLCASTGADTREPWPDVRDVTLLRTLDTWLVPWLDGVTRATHLARVDLAGALHSLLNWNRQQRLDELAPTHLTVPSGRPGTQPLRAPAGSLRYDHDAPRWRWACARATQVTVPGPPAGAGDTGSRKLLEYGLSRGQERTEGTLSAPLLARGSAAGASHEARQATPITGGVESENHESARTG
jgi:ATP-dependent helicase HrpB